LSEEQKTVQKNPQQILVFCVWPPPTHHAAGFIWALSTPPILWSFVLHNLVGSQEVAGSKFKTN